MRWSVIDGRVHRSQDHRQRLVHKDEYKGDLGQVSGIKHVFAPWETTTKKDNVIVTYTNKYHCSLHIKYKYSPAVLVCTLSVPELVGVMWNKSIYSVCFGRRLLWSMVFVGMADYILGFAFPLSAWLWGSERHVSGAARDICIIYQEMSKSIWGVKWHCGLSEQKKCL